MEVTRIKVSEFSISGLLVTIWQNYIQAAPIEIDNYDKEYEIRQKTVVLI